VQQWSFGKWLTMRTLLTMGTLFDVVPSSVMVVRWAILITTGTPFPGVPPPNDHWGAGQTGQRIPGACDFGVSFGGLLFVVSIKKNVPCYIAAAIPYYIQCRGCRSM
jgi:hypothetical protein